MVASLRHTCPTCGLYSVPARFNRRHPIKFAQVTYLSGGRGRGRWEWLPAPDHPGRRECLFQLHSQLRRCLDSVDRELSLCDSVIVPSSTVPFPVVSAPKPVALARLRAEYAVATVNPILVA